MFEVNFPDPLTKSIENHIIIINDMLKQLFKYYLLKYRRRFTHIIDTRIMIKTLRKEGINNG